MLANHTSIRNLFKIIIEGQKKMRRRGANLHTYKEFSMFRDTLEEFDQAEESVLNLMEEYAAAEKPDYINWGAADDQQYNMGGGMGGGDGSMEY